jgi:hypothetical protein
MKRQRLLDQVAPLKAKLLAARRRRDMPLVDDKVLTDWNGMMISGLATAGDLLGDAHMVDLAARAANFVLATLRDAEGRLLHSWRRAEDGADTTREARVPAFLSDYVFLIRGLLALHEATGDEHWLAQAKQLTAEQSTRLEDSKGGFFTASEQPDVLFRSKEIFDGALPATNAVAALNLLDLARKEGPDPWLPWAEQTLKAFTLFAERQPEGARMMTAAVRRYHRLVGGPIGPEAEVEATVMNLAERAARKLVVARLDAADPDAEGWRPFTLTLKVQDGWHLYAPVESKPRALEPVRIDGVGSEVRDLLWPDPTPWQAGDEELAVYSGQTEVRGELRGEGEPRLRVRFQPCDESRCLAAVAIEVTAS